ncbi:hypothetical protein AVEN_34093-1 [Araneus ventricosus]|uniref:Uncharacterized protein n=1 Tax=Araneus ventricosus TaxID=182803 RepID=A0A4Y2FXX2_ARAVE|nr:hypothetical protein AVEN_34093-1 [Araneus ventricosus]
MERRKSTSKLSNKSSDGCTNSPSELNSRSRQWKRSQHSGAPYMELAEFSLEDGSVDGNVVAVESSARPSPRVLPPTENHYRRTVHAGYNGMAFTTWVTLPGEKTPDVHRPFHPGSPPPPR